MSEKTFPHLLGTIPRWVLWRTVQRDGRKTKPPYTIHNTPASATNPQDWASFNAVVQAIEKSPDLFDGLGFVLGKLDNGDLIAGIDLDTCLENDETTAWASAFLRAIPSYAEVSPSGNGIKILFRVRASDIDMLRHALQLTVNQWGRKRTFGNGNGHVHPPAAEIYLADRFFTITGNQWPTAPDEVCLITYVHIAALAALFGPITAHPRAAGNHTEAWDGSLPDIATKLEDALCHPVIAARWEGSTDGLNDTSRSALDMSLGSLLKAQGFSLAEMRAALIQYPYGKGQERADDARYFERIFNRASTVPPQDPPPHIADVPPNLEEKRGDTQDDPPPRTKTETERLIHSDASRFVEADIPKRPWIVPGYILRRAVTLVAGPPSAGKSSLMIGWAVALALGLPWNRFKPDRPYRVLIYNVEDDDDEQKRRLSAILRQFGKTSIDIEDKILRVTPKGIGTLLHHNKSQNVFNKAEIFSDLELDIAQFQPDVIILDPLSELHDTEENDNTAMRIVAAYFRTLAIEANCAAVLIQHTRKGSDDGAGDPDIVRGASSQIGSARVVLTVVTMTEADADEFQIQRDTRQAFFRVDSAKQNYAPPRKAEWFQRFDYTLDNEEDVVAANPWTPPADNSNTAAVQAIEIAIANGCPNTRLPYSPRLSKMEPRSVTHLFNNHGLGTKSSQQRLLSQLYATGFLKQHFKSPADNKAIGIRAPDGRPEAKWIDP